MSTLSKTAPVPRTVSDGSAPAQDYSAPDVSQNYEGESGEEYYRAKFGEKFELGRRFQLRYFAPYCSADRDLLDFGCADGLSLRTLPARRRIGIEINPAARQRCQRLHGAQPHGIELYSSLNSVADDSVDLAISNHCLEHVPRPFDALKEIGRVLRPGGELVLVVPIDDWRSAKNRRWKPDDKDHHLYTWSPMNLGNLVSEAGLSCRELRVCCSAWSPKLFWIARHFGQHAFGWACRTLAALRRRRELLCVASKPLSDFTIGPTTGAPV